MKRMVRVGKWAGEASKYARVSVAHFVADYFGARRVWTRREHGRLVVAVEETHQNTEAVERFRFTRVMAERFVFAERDDGAVEVTLNEEVTS